MSNFITVAKVGEIPEGQNRIVWVEGQPVAVFHVGGKYFAMDDVCSHDGGPVAEGTLEGYEVECPRHGARFDIRTGKPLSLPATAPVAVHRVRVEGDAIQVALGDDGADAADSSAGGVRSGNTREELSEAERSPGMGGAGRERGAPSQDGEATPDSSRVFPDRTPPAPDVAGAPAAETSAPSQQEVVVRSALETVMDPEIGLSVIDLGLIREIHFFPDRTLVRMMLTTPFCPYAPQMMADVKQATEGVIALPAEVEILPDAWSPQLMPDPGLLGFSY